MPKRAALILEDGRVFEGFCFGAEATAYGEIVFDTGGRVQLQDGLAIRRASAEKGIPCLTSLDTVRAVIGALSDSGHVFNVQPLSEYLRGRK